MSALPPAAKMAPAGVRGVQDVAAVRAPRQQKGAPAPGLRVPRQVAGLSLVTLHDAPPALRASAVDVYLSAQKGGPVIQALGFSSDELRQYATFMVNSAARQPWNVVAVDDATGEAKGLYLCLHDIASVDGAGLPAPARAHWGIFLTIAAAVEKRVPGAAQDCLAAVIGCAVAEYQGKGLYPAMAALNADIAAEHGFHRMWSWTHNPLLVQALGKTDGGASVISRITTWFFRAPTLVSNNLMIPAAHAVGLLPRNRVAFFVNGADIPALQALKNNVLIAVTPLITTKMAKRRGPPVAQAKL